MFGSVDWQAVFSADTPVLEMIVRGSAMYLALFVLLRVVLKRQTGTLGTTDLLLITLLADASQNGMAGEYHSLSDGLVLVVTIMFWDYAFDWLGYHYAWFRRLTESPPLLLIDHGRLLRRNLRRELVTEAELLGQLRERGIDDYARVRFAHMESDGRISVVEYGDGRQRPSPDRRDEGG